MNPCARGMCRTLVFIVLAVAAAPRTTPAQPLDHLFRSGDDGTLMLNMRNYTSVRIRQVSLSRDGGATWSAPAGDAALVEPVCQASLLWSEHGGREPVLAFSNPASQTSRSRMTVRLSDDGGRSWGRQAVVHEGPSAYSNLVTLPNGNLAILFEGGVSSPYEGIVFKELPFGRFEAGRTGPSAAREWVPVAQRHSPGPPTR